MREMTYRIQCEDSNTGSIPPAGTVYRYVIHLRLLNLVNVCGSAIGFLRIRIQLFISMRIQIQIVSTVLTVIYCMTMNTRTADFAVLCNFCQNPESFYFLFFMDSAPGSDFSKILLKMFFFLIRYQHFFFTLVCGRILRNDYPDLSFASSDPDLILA